ncbi:hypothetical protein C8R47DRAFT_1214045 [Mycena vitilis]|nr:hypothetical protein C8R47DRAFT_1214045 [Mycena vitilis]
MAPKPAKFDKDRDRIQRERQRLDQHAYAQRRYRERYLNYHFLRIREEISSSSGMSTLCATKQGRRAEINKSDDKKKKASDQRRELDEEYRERQRQKKWIAQYGRHKFDLLYKPLFLIHGNTTWKLPVVKAAVARWKMEAEREAGATGALRSPEAEED